MGTSAHCKLTTKLKYISAGQGQNAKKLIFKRQYILILLLVLYLTNYGTHMALQLIL